MKKIIVALLSSTILSACVSIKPPPGQESDTTFTQETPMGYKDAYRLISKKMRGCYRVIGVLGNGYDVQDDIDTDLKEARVEVFHLGHTGASKFEDSIFSRIVTIKQSGTGSVITTAGTTTRYTYMNHQAIKGWLRGNEDCSIAKD